MEQKIDCLWLLLIWATSWMVFVRCSCWVFDGKNISRQIFALSPWKSLPCARKTSSGFLSLVVAMRLLLARIKRWNAKFVEFSIAKSVYESQHLLFTQVKAHIMRCESSTHTHIRPLKRARTHTSGIKYTHILNEFRCKFNSCLLVHKRPYFSLLHNIYDMDVAVAVAIIVVRTHGRGKKNSKLILSVFEFFHAPLYANSLALCLLNIGSMLKLSP